MKKSVKVAELNQLLKDAKQPIMVVGQGVRLSGAVKLLSKTVRKLKIPTVTSRLGTDAIEFMSPYYAGHIGVNGTKPGWLAIDNADLIIVVGCRLAYAAVSYDPENWGAQAKKIMVDIDSKELEKPEIKIEIKLNMDAKAFLNKLLKVNYKTPLKWVCQCQEWKQKYPVVTEKMRQSKKPGSYVFFERLSQLASADDIVIVDTGSCFHTASQAWQIKKGQKYLTTGGLSSMGWWAAGLGGAVLGHTILITGDGSIQMNIQELATVKHYKLPIKLFVINNDGYGLIRATQKTYFGKDDLIGESPETGMWCPNLQKVAERGYGIKYMAIKSTEQMDQVIKKVLAYKSGPMICEVFVPRWEKILKRAKKFKKPQSD